MRLNDLSLGLILVVGVFARDAQQVNGQPADAQLELQGEFVKEFRSGLVGRALSNLQTYAGSLGGITADPITNSGDHSRPYMVAGDTFPDYNDAISRSCANQNNKCSDAANNPAKAAPDLTVESCQSQSSSCIQAGATATQTNFQVLTSSNAEFDFICDS